MGVRLMNLAAGDSVVGLALNAESIAEAEEADMADALDPADLDPADLDPADTDPADTDPAGSDPDGAEEGEAE
jgi:dynein assembly factor 2